MHQGGRRLAEQLTLRQACERLGGEWVAPATARATEVHMRKLKRRLLRLQHELRVRLVFGGGRPGRSGGGPCWTTWQALRRAGLVDQTQELADALRVNFEELRALTAQALERDRILAREVAGQSRTILDHESRIRRLERIGARP